MDTPICKIFMQGLGISRTESIRKINNLLYTYQNSENLSRLAELAKPKIKINNRKYRRDVKFGRVIGV